MKKTAEVKRVKAFNNLEAELARARIRKYELAETLGIYPSTLSLRLKGEAEFRLDEMRLIRDKIQAKTGEYYTLDYLFSKD